MLRFIIDTGAEFSIVNPNICSPKWKVNTNENCLQEIILETNRLKFLHANNVNK